MNGMPYVLEHPQTARPLIMGRHGMVSSGHHLASLAGPLSMAVAGAVDGWIELHRCYGTMDLA